MNGLLNLLDLAGNTIAQQQQQIAQLQAQLDQMRAQQSPSESESAG